jgi:hypothetical protein
MRQIDAAAENMEAAGLHDVAEELRREASKMRQKAEHVDEPRNLGQPGGRRSAGGQ